MKLLDLPLDILIDNILYNLDAQSLGHLACTNSEFHQLINDELLWKHRVFSDYNLPHDASFRRSGWKQLYSKLKDSVVYTWGENMDGRLGHPPQTSTINLRFRNRYMFFFSLFFLLLSLKGRLLCYTVGVICSFLDLATITPFKQMVLIIKGRL